MIYYRFRDTFKDKVHDDYERCGRIADKMLTFDRAYWRAWWIGRLSGQIYEKDEVLRNKEW